MCCLQYNDIRTACRSRSQRKNIWCRHTSVSKEAISVMCLKETQQYCQNWHDQQNVEGNVCQVREGLLQSIGYHGDTRLDMPATSQGWYMLTSFAYACAQVSQVQPEPCVKITLLGCQKKSSICIADMQVIAALPEQAELQHVMTKSGLIVSVLCTTHVKRGHCMMIDDPHHLRQN